MEHSNVAQFTLPRPAARRDENLYIAEAIAAAEHDCAACFELGVAHSTGINGLASDLVAAHMWFNLAAARGHEEAASCRAEIAEEMTAREIAEAQRRARHWLASSRKLAA